MTKIINNNSLGFEDVFIVPQYSEIASRRHADVSCYLTNTLNVPVPVISANMDTVTGPEMCIALARSGAIGALHRFMTIEENAKAVEGIITELTKDFADLAPYKFMVSVGVGNDALPRAEALYDAGARMFIIDIAHGHSLLMKTMIEDMREGFGDEIFIVAGNVATPEGACDLARWGADAIKVGIGPGCFAAGTRVLMANGEYKNIESILPGDRVINKDGNPVSVRGVESKGTRLVGKYRTNVSANWTVCTPDHLHWVGDLSSTNQKAVSSSGYARLLDKKSKTTPKQSKYKWMEIFEAVNKNTVCLMPKNIKFELAERFLFDLYKKNIHTKKKENYVTLTPTYELGYIFGTFLGDGHARSLFNKKRKSTSGSVSWYFGSNEIDIANKLTSCIEKTFNRNAKTNVPKNKNIIVVNFYDKPFAEFMLQFGKKQNKKLPIELLTDDTRYLEGLLHGLIDSDGCISEDGRIKFTNTSEDLAELFCVLNIILKKHVPNFELRKPTKGGLKNVSIDNIRPSFAVRPLKAPKNRMTKEYQVVKLLDSDFNQLVQCEVFDIEVDDDTQSFIANNSIVHNSACTTKNVTGVTVPQFTAVLDIAEALDRLGMDVLLIADGGIREIGDIAKALGAGADLVMCGRLFAGCHEAPGERIDGKKVYRGSSSADVNKILKSSDNLPTPEGISTLISTDESPASDLVKKIQGGLQSAFSYSNAKSLKEFHARCVFGIRKTEIR